MHTVLCIITSIVSYFSLSLLLPSRPYGQYPLPVVVNFVPHPGGTALRCCPSPVCCPLGQRTPALKAEVDAIDRARRRADELQVDAYQLQPVSRKPRHFISGRQVGRSAWSPGAAQRSQNMPARLSAEQLRCVKREKNLARSPARTSRTCSLDADALAEARPGERVGELSQQIYASSHDLECTAYWPAYRAGKKLSSGAPSASERLGSSPAASCLL